MYRAVNEINAGLIKKLVYIACKVTVPRLTLA